MIIYKYRILSNNPVQNDIADLQYVHKHEPFVYSKRCLMHPPIQIKRQEHKSEQR